MTTTKPLITAEYLLRAHDLGRCELVRGELITMSPAGAEHGSIISNIQLCLALYVSREGVGRVFGAETGFQIAHEPDSVRAPDVAFVTRDRLPSQPPQGFFPDRRIWPSKLSRPAIVTAKSRRRSRVGWTPDAGSSGWSIPAGRRYMSTKAIARPRFLGSPARWWAAPCCRAFRLR